MGRGQRLGLILSAVVFAAIAFIVLRPDDDDDSQPARDTAAQTETQPDAPVERPEEPPAEPEPRFETIRIRGGDVQGGRRQIEASKGDEVRIEVRSDTPDDIHLHGYDLSRAVGPGKTARFRFEADIEGVFELEAHDLGHLVLAELVVEP